MLKVLFMFEEDHNNTTQYYYYHNYYYIKSKQHCVEDAFSGDFTTDPLFLSLLFPIKKKN